MRRYIMGVVKKILTPQQRTILRKIYNETFNRWICRLLSFKLILVLGCQRSGTTLLYMMLTSHPKITGKDESESGFNFPKSSDFVKALLNRRMICYKLPTKTPELDLIIQRFSLAKAVWITRNPLSVISSMKSLRMDHISQGKNWLQTCGKGELKRHAVLFPEINNIDFKTIDQISLGAYIWKYKMITRDKYIGSKIKTFALDYEQLLKNPKKILSPILKNLGLNWSDAILHHEQSHKGKKYPGRNIGDKPLDRQRKPPDLNDEEIKRIRDIVENCNYFNIGKSNTLS